jgi:hypothetical protein
VLSFSIAYNGLRLAVSGGLTANKLSPATKVNKKQCITNLLVTRHCSKAMLAPVLLLLSVVAVPRVGFLSFVFVVRGGIFENFFFLLGGIGTLFCFLPYP